ncbi:hypothetical protein NKH77_00210 [Streptomyces sp. M19]
MIASRGFLAAGLIGGTVFAGYYGVLFRAPSLIEQATGGGPWKPACSWPRPPPARCWPGGWSAP